MRRVGSLVAGLLVLVVTLNVVLMPVAGVVHAHGCEEPHLNEASDVKLPQGSIVWSREDFTNWLASARLNTADANKLRLLLEKLENGAVLLFRASDYNAWLSSLDLKLAEIVDKVAVEVQGSDLPRTIVVEEFKEGLSLDATIADEDYVILLADLDFCIQCGDLVVAIVEAYLRYRGYDQIADLIRLAWEIVKFCLRCGNRLGYESTPDTTQCPYQPWCQGQSAWVVWTDGWVAECACDCGANWVIYNPLVP